MRIQKQVPTEKNKMYYRKEVFFYLQFFLFVCLLTIDFCFIFPNKKILNKIHKINSLLTLVKRKKYKNFGIDSFFLPNTDADDADERTEFLPFKHSILFHFQYQGGKFDFGTGF